MRYLIILLLFACGKPEDIKPLYRVYEIEMRSDVPDMNILYKDTAGFVQQDQAGVHWKHTWKQKGEQKIYYGVMGSGFMSIQLSIDSKPVEYVQGDRQVVLSGIY